MNKINTLDNNFEKEKVQSLHGIGLNTPTSLMKGWTHVYLQHMYDYEIYKAAQNSWETFREGLEKLQKLSAASQKKVSVEKYIYNKQVLESQMEHLAQDRFVARQLQHLKERDSQDHQISESTFSAHLLLACPV